MDKQAEKFALQKKSWAKLRRIHPSPIDLSKIDLIREQDSSFLLDPDKLVSLVLDLGLNDDGLEDFPESLLPHCGRGLLIWQYPREFALYLSHLMKLRVQSYVEVGVRHGGTFVATVECLERCGPFQSALAIDIMTCPSMKQYSTINPKAVFAQVNSQSEEFAKVLDERGPFDAALIDANHDEEECRHEFTVLKDRCAMIALHDISNSEFPAVRRVWKDIKSLEDYRCFEYITDFPERHTPMGIGLAVRRDRG